MVSVLCTTYNHEAYIAQALQSMVDQKTTFPIEVIVHDDASTDGTARIIRAFEEKYPQIIRPIYQTENQHSKHVKIMPTHVIPCIRGKYFAMCEGDDFWIDPNKLQTQVDYMEAHPNCTLCIHNAKTVDRQGQDVGVVAPVEHSRNVDCAEVIIGGGGFCATNSILAPARLAKNLPPYFAIASFDLVWQMYLASEGETYCFSELMSAYRIGVQHSWTDRVMNGPSNAPFIKHLEKVNAVRAAFDEYTAHRYHDAVANIVAANEFQIYRLRGDFGALKREPYASYRKTLPARVRGHLWLEEHCPVALRIWKKRKGKRR